MAQLYKAYLDYLETLGTVAISDDTEPLPTNNDPSAWMSKVTVQNGTVTISGGQTGQGTPNGNVAVGGNSGTGWMGISGGVGAGVLNPTYPQPDWVYLPYINVPGHQGITVPGSGVDPGIYGQSLAEKLADLLSQLNQLNTYAQSHQFAFDVVQNERDILLKDREALMITNQLLLDEVQKLKEQVAKLTEMSQPERFTTLDLD